MRVPSIPIMLAGVVLTLAAGAADAYTCYVVLDANDNVVSRDTLPPVDMSAQGKAARDALSRSGKYLMIIEVDQCLPVGAAIGSTDSGTSTPADYVARVRPVMTRNAAAGAATRTPSGAAGMSPPPPAPAPAGPATGQRSSPGAY